MMEIDRNQIGEGVLTGEEEIYRENILDLYKNPHNYGRLDRPSFRRKELNPLCGDVIVLDVKLNADKSVENASFTGSGCAISQSSASLLTDFIKQKTVSELKKIAGAQILELLGIPISHVRMKCALLSLKTLQKGIEEYERGNHGK